MADHKPYSIARAELVAEQIARFSRQHVHQLAGHSANLAFWLFEAASALRAIDEYHRRFLAMRDAQLSWIEAHNTRVDYFCPACNGACEFGPHKPPRPHRVPSEDLDTARAALQLAVRQLLARLFKAGLLAAAEARREAAALGVPLEPEDLD